MKVFELMAKLADFPCGADIQCVCSDEKTVGELAQVDFDGTKAADAFVNLHFDAKEIV